MWRNIFLSSVPIFVAIDALGVLPMFIALTHHFNKKERQRILLDSLLTSYGLCLSFIFFGKPLLAILGLSWGDFMIAGGIILFILAINDLVTQERPESEAISKDVGIVPIGTPLIAGPAVLTTLLILLDTYKMGIVIISVSLNIIFAGIVFSLSETILRIIGRSGTKVFSKIASLILAAIAVMMIRKGLVNLLALLQTRP